MNETLFTVLQWLTIAACVFNLAMCVQQWRQLRRLSRIERLWHDICRQAWNMRGWPHLISFYYARSLIERDAPPEVIDRIVLRADE